MVNAIGNNPQFFPFLKRFLPDLDSRINEEVCSQAESRQSLSVAAEPEPPVATDSLGLRRQTLSEVHSSPR